MVHVAGKKEVFSTDSRYQGVVNLDLIRGENLLQGALYGSEKILISIVGGSPNYQYENLTKCHEARDKHDVSLDHTVPTKIKTRNFLALTVEKQDGMWWALDNSCMHPT